MDEAGFGDAMVDIYDRGSLLGPSERASPTDAVRFLARLAGDGPALELGVGTGRVAIPLAEAGVVVRGLDVSARMLDVLATKPGGDRVETAVGDMAELDVPGPFALVYVVGSSLFGVTDQNRQVACLTGASSVLAPDGHLVVEAFVPDLARFGAGQRAVAVREIGSGGVHLDVVAHDPVEQTLTSQQVVLAGDGVRLYPSRLRYVWPAELDLMGRLAGLSLVERHGGWAGQPYTGAGSHVSVYTRAGS